MIILFDFCFKHRSRYSLRQKNFFAHVFIEFRQFARKKKLKVETGYFSIVMSSLLLLLMEVTVF